MFTWKGIHETDALKRARIREARCALEGEWRRGVVGLFRHVHPDVTVAGTTSQGDLTTLNMQVCSDMYTLV